MPCILLTESGIAMDQVTLQYVYVGDKIQTKRGTGTVENIQFGLSFTYVTVSF